MTVQELIKKLSVFPLNMKVGYDSDGHDKEVKYVAINEGCEYGSDFKEGEKFVYLT